MSENLFEEAIADARKIRDLAEENAKKAVLEAVTPKIKEFIENTILEQDSYSESDGDDYENLDSENENLDNDPHVELDESAIKSLLGLLGENGSDTTDLKEAVSRLTGNERDKLFGLIDKNSQINENYNSGDIINLKENNKMNSREKYYEIDLKALREAVEDEEANEMYDVEEALYEEEEEDDNLLADDLPVEDEMPEMEDDSAMISKDDLEAQIEELIADLGLEIGAGGEVEMEDDAFELDVPEMEMEEEEVEEEQLDEVFDIDPRMLQRELKRIKRLSEASGKGLANESGGITKDFEHHFGGKGSKNAGKGGSFGGGKPGKDVLSEMRRALRNQRHQNGALQNKLTKYRSAVNTLREQLEELNLFNAKLLYVNKLLQNKSINESQKRSIVKALDEAKDLREAKVLYKSLTESFSKSTKKSTGRLNESARFASSSRTTKPAGSHSNSNSAAGEVDRWARLAGLRK
jgi:hypothetical protein